MFTRTFITLVLLIAAVTALASARSKQGTESSDASIPMPAVEALPADAAARWLLAATPGEPHRSLQQYVGTWEMSGECHLVGSVSAEMTGTAEIESILGGRYLLERYTGTLLMSDGDGELVPFPIEGLSILGYDNMQRTYRGLWIDSASTQPVIGSGQFDEATGGFEMRGVVDDPISGRRDLPVEFRSRRIEEDTFDIEIRARIEGVSHVYFEGRYTRVHE